MYKIIYTEYYGMDMEPYVKVFLYTHKKRAYIGLYDRLNDFLNEHQTNFNMCLKECDEKQRKSMLKDSSTNEFKYFYNRDITKRMKKYFKITKGGKCFFNYFTCVKYKFEIVKIEK